MIDTSYFVLSPGGERGTITIILHHFAILCKICYNNKSEVILMDKVYICRMWKLTTPDGWQSDFAEFDTKEAAFSHGNAFVDMIGYGDLGRTFDVYEVEK